MPGGDRCASKQPKTLYVYSFTTCERGRCGGRQRWYGSEQALRSKSRFAVRCSDRRVQWPCGGISVRDGKHP